MSKPNPAKANFGDLKNSYMKGFINLYKTLFRSSDPVAANVKLTGRRCILTGLWFSLKGALCSFGKDISVRGERCSSTDFYLFIYF